MSVNCAQQDIADQGYWGLERTTVEVLNVPASAYVYDDDAGKFIASILSNNLSKIF